MIDMHFTFLRLVITPYLIYEAYAIYNKDVTCIIDKGKEPICKAISNSNHRRAHAVNNNLPSHDPYIPRTTNTVFYDCSSLKCLTIILHSLTQLTSPTLNLKSCFSQSITAYECETIRYNYFKNVDKLLFLTNNIHDKTFYMVDCLIYSDGGRVCHKKDDVDSYNKLVDTGTIARPKERSILSQDEFICEESQNKEVNCDLNPYVPFSDGLKLRESAKPDTNVLLKTGSYVVVMSRNCVGSWCGYSGHVSPTRRNPTPNRYEPPGGKVYRCYYAKNQQICKELYGNNKAVYNDRGWLSTR